MSDTLLAESTVQAERVLAKAVLRAGEQLGLKQSELAAVLGVHRTAISRMRQHLSLNPQSKQGELALLLIRLARGLYLLTGGDEEWIQHFMQTPNGVTGGTPKQQIASIQGLVAVLQFVDALHGKA